MKSPRNPAPATVDVNATNLQQSAGQNQQLPWYKSIKTRVTLFTLTIFLIVIWTLTLHASRALREDMTHFLSEQQLSVASILANTVNQQMSNRLEDLRITAALITHLQADDVAAIQQQLDNMKILRRQFNGGVFIATADKTIIAQVDAGHSPLLADTGDSDIIAQVLASGQPHISAPILNEQLDDPSLHMAVPIRDAEGHVIGAVGGIIHLATTNFLDQISHGHPGKGDDYLLVDPAHRRILAATDKRRTMEPSPPAEQFPEIARFLAGEEGSAIFTNPRGVEVLQSVRRVPVAGWYVAVALPTSEAFAPIHELQRRMLISALLLSLLASGLTWWMLRRQLSPIFDTLQTLTTLSRNPDRATLMQPLSASRNDEIGQLIGGFNQLLHTLGERETELYASNARLKEAQRISHIGSWAYDTATGRLDWTEEASHIFGLDPQNPHPTYAEFTCVIHPEDREKLEMAYFQAIQERTIFELDHRLLLPDGRIKWVREHGLAEFDADGNALRTLGTVQDITAQKQAETELRIAAAAFESQLGIVVTDAQWIIQRVNPAFTRITGYSVDEAIGQTPHLVRSSRHSDEFYDTVWQSVHTTGSWEGEVWHRNKQGHDYPSWLTITAVKDAQGTVTHYVGAQQDISDRKYAEERIHQLAYFDQLTGLPNRTLLLDRLRQAIAGAARSQELGALLFIDLDKFKALNDSLGHDKGDLLLQQAAQRLAACVRGCDTVARLGGDEFIIMLTNLSSKTQDAAHHAEVIGEKILAELNRHYLLDGTIFYSTASIGITVFGQKNNHIDTLLKQADLAMYRAKANGRNTLHFFDPEMEAETLNRVQLENDLHQALEKQQFQLHYQAQMSGGVLVGSEALVRWLHPHRGLIPPDEFIPLAEETGLILPLGNWVLETACKQLVQWAKNPEMNHLSIAVNVSARQFRKPDFVEQVSNILSLTGANPKRLKLELTESLLVEDVEEVIEKMRALKTIGVGFALDDFGTGYSSLYYLKHLPFDQMKIDRSFVRDILDDTNDATIARTIVTLAQSLGLGVIAEGVENQAQLDFLAELHCHAYQGYYFGRPLPIDEFEEYALGY
ncbi:MAG: EAL domain-containing protein [Sterolibacterium sp.]|nr:EAL domain-containing protein [Sterolibacterium sp.]